MNQSLVQLMQLICKQNTDDQYFAIDVGAHHGEYSKFLITTGLFKKIISFEPNPTSYHQSLCSVFSTESCKYEGVNLALGDINGSLDLHCDTDTATASLLPYETSYISHGEIKKNNVEVSTLDMFLDGYDSDGRLMLIKIDTQGNDLSVIKGSIQTIMKHRPVIQTEFIYIPLYIGQCSPLDLTSAMNALDYEMYSLNNLHVTAEGKLAFCDALFIPKELKVPLTQTYSCIDDQASYLTQISTLSKICAERLALIERLHQEASIYKASVVHKQGFMASIIRKLSSWVQ
jgi:FkbM family methyltransferase